MGRVRMGKESIPATRCIYHFWTSEGTPIARLPILNADADQCGALLNEFLRVAHTEDGTLKLEKVDATTIGVVANEAAAAQSNSAAINNFLPIRKDIQPTWCCLRAQSLLMIRSTC
jgi:hypothetical protein